MHSLLCYGGNECFLLCRFKKRMVKMSFSEHERYIEDHLDGEHEMLSQAFGAEHGAWGKVIVVFYQYRGVNFIQLHVGSETVLMPLSESLVMAAFIMALGEFCGGSDYNNRSEKNEC